MTGKLDKDGVKPIDSAKVEQLAAQGLTVKQIASCLNCSRTTLYERMGSKQDVADAIKRGRAKGIGTVTNSLFKSANSGNITAQIFYLKTKGKDRGYVERQEIESNIKVDVDMDKLREAIKNGVPYQ